MEQVKEKIISWLFKTGAIKICPENKPFWYTSGKIGPYYINTHYLYGSEEKATELLAIIDNQKEQRLQCSGIILSHAMSNYNTDVIYRGLIDSMVSYIKQYLDVNHIDYVSGGERRDWFFSLITAYMLEKPHVTIFKDQKAVLFDGVESVDLSSTRNIKNKGVFLHIADIITEASSYIKTWIPAIEKLGGKMAFSMVVVDRLQGGTHNLTRCGVKSHCLVEVDKSMFDMALSLGYISPNQHKLLNEYILDPTGTMRRFLLSHPEFIEESLNSPDFKTRERARMCIENNLYNI